VTLHWNALAQPFHDGDFRFRLPPALIRAQIASDFIPLIAWQPGPLGMQSGGAPKHPLSGIHLACIHCCTSLKLIY